MPEVNIADLYGRLGGIDASVKLMQQESAHAAEKRGEVYKALEHVRVEIHALNTLIQAIDRRVAMIEPDWQDWQRTRHQVAGAGRLGRALWWIGGVIIAAASSIVGALAWLPGGPRPPG